MTPPRRAPIVYGEMDFRPQRKVAIVGGGFAAVEALLALRTLLGERAELTLIAEGERFAYRPAATAEAFQASTQPALSWSLAEIAKDAGARFIQDRLEAVAPAEHSIELASGACLRYDSLILALGARARVAIPGALTFRDQRDVLRMRALLAELRRGAPSRIVFAVPSGCTWTLPLYELAMLTANWAQEHGVDAQISIVAPLSAPLEIFGQDASALVRGQMIERGVRFRGGLVPARVRQDGALQLHFGGTVAADRVVAAPQLLGPRIAGVPSGWWGFTPVDAEGRVEGLLDVHAAGDMTATAIKQGGMATQQADAIARTIAAAEGVEVSVPPPIDPGHTIQARLLGGAQTLSLRASLSAEGELRSASARPMPQPAPMHEKVNGRYLSAYLEQRREASRAARSAPPPSDRRDLRASNGV
jgi:sulfide:quinone oxidoreductase